MANQSADPEKQGVQRETLEEFESRFGQLSDRMEQATHPEGEREPLPLAETQDRIDERSQAAEAPHDDYEFLPGKTSQPAFQAAAEAQEQPIEQDGRNSQMVAEDAPENNMPPPEESSDQDRETHQDRMAQDDAQSRAGDAQEQPNWNSEEFLDKFEAHLEAEGYDPYQSPSQERDQGYDQS